MRKIPYLILIISLLIFSSCENSEVTKLKNKVDELEKLNKNLRDSLFAYKDKKIISTQVISVPENKTLKPKKPNNFTFYLNSTQDYPPYDVITSIDDQDPIYKNRRKPYFDYEFVPENDDDKKFGLLVRFKDKDSITIIQANINMDENDYSMNF